MIARVIALLLLAFAVPSWGATSKAENVSFLLSQVRTSTAALIAGTVTFYEPGTTTKKDVYLDRDKTTVAANPYTLDANGTAQLYAHGNYRVVIKDRAGVTKFDRDNLYFEGKETPTAWVSILDYGADGTDLISDKDAINAAIADLNSGNINNIYFPAGTYIVDGELTSITASWVDIFGDGYSSLIEKTAGTGTVFKLGTSGTTSVGVSIKNLAFDVDHSNGILSGYVFDLVKSNDTTISNIRAGTPSVGKGVSGFVKLGDNTLSTRTQTSKISNIQVHAHGSANGTVFDVQSATVCRIAFVVVNVNNQSTGSGPLAIHIHPENSVVPFVNIVDSIEWLSVEINYPNYNVAHAMDIDGTSGRVNNQWFTDCIFDQTTDTAVTVHVDASTPAGETSRINNLFFTSSRFYPNSGEAVLIDNSGSKSIYKVKFTGCTFATADSSVFKVTNGNEKVQIKAVACDFVDRGGVVARPVIEVDAVDSLILTGNEVDGNYYGEPCAFDNFVKITGKTRSHIVANNELSRITSNGLLKTDIVTNDSDNRIFASNAGDNSFVQTVSTTDATPTTILAFDVEEGGVYYVEVLVTGRQSDGSNRAVYKIGAYFYRNSGGNATQQGSTIQLITPIESDAAWNVEFYDTSSAGAVRVIGKAATAIDWGAELSIKKL